MPPATRRPAFWRTAGFRATLYQVLVIALLVGAVAWMTETARQAMHARGIASGFDFLLDRAGFAIGHAFFVFTPQDTYLRAFVVGLGNSLVVAAAGLVTATVMGVALGLSRLSGNWLLSRAAGLYVELFRNTPQLVQIVFWYALFTLLPGPRQAWNLLDLAFVSNRGLLMPWPAQSGVFGLALLLLVPGVFLARAFLRLADRRRRAGRPLRGTALLAAVVLLAPSAVGWLALGAPTGWSVPALRGFNFVGGLGLSPEFLALYFGLSFYIAAFVAEIVRAGILSVGRGQVEAAQAIGLGRADLYRKIVFPQAMRVVVPPLAAQYISLVKNSSLGVAIGYPELFSVTNTVLTLSGHTIEAIAIMALVYLVLALAIGALADIVNRAVRIRER
ncbi:general L-amino acid transport system permease protein [Stella humosa]|uniref:General L-amino acid transport system permease protein n=1 Tax=Stella humosa TaxID=94 RepID=A0A3N1KUV1_9PROT|nr:ABC transporter permease subunit [Stella humosa]ROP84361.1 general L-amino acid transport system permease protein [Stella humosa]BBK33876.1 ABC transporter permease [Stella humosa]